VSAAGSLRNPETPRHAAIVRLTHWLTVLCFFALLVSGLEIVVSHPRFCWGEVGNSVTRPLFTLHIPSSRNTVPTGYSYVLPDQNGWSRCLHFQAAWALVSTGLAYGIAGLWIPATDSAKPSAKAWARPCPKLAMPGTPASEPAP
jgi:thiosulfate reductase cytochrome b subunit